jgi:hypothetical protein
MKTEKSLWVGGRMPVLCTVQGSHKIQAYKKGMGSLDTIVCSRWYNQKKWVLDESQRTLS